jgi:hypothetical protein
LSKKSPARRGAKPVAKKTSLTKVPKKPRRRLRRTRPARPPCQAGVGVVGEEHSAQARRQCGQGTQQGEWQGRQGCSRRSGRGQAVAG